MNKIDLLDIVAPLAPPPAPPPYGWIALGAVLLVLVMAGVLYLVWRRNRACRTALVQMKRAAHALHEQRIDARAAVFQISVTLRGLPGKPMSSGSADWADFSRALDQARFAPCIPSADTSAHLIERARDLLRTSC